MAQPLSEKHLRETRIYRTVMAVIAVTFIAFGILQLTGVVRI